MQITGLLINNGMQAKLIQSNEGFNLYDLLEIRYFIDRLNLADDIFIISDDTWADAKRELFNVFRRSKNNEMCRNLIKDFEVTNPKYRYKSDFISFVRESKLEDFYGVNNDTIFVSTIHKSKGREFENVYLMLNQHNNKNGVINDEEKRLLYVAMTRAKNRLIIHSNSSSFDFIKTEGLRIIHDHKNYTFPSILAVQLSHSDVWLDYFIPRQKSINRLISGDELTINGSLCLASNGSPVLNFSKQFMKQIDYMKQRKYQPTKAKIKFIVYWQKENSDTEIKIILPEIYFERIDN